jgi:adenylate cyclase
MKLLAETGRRTDALRQYRNCFESLERELGAQPSTETRNVYERIRDTEGETEAAPKAAPAAVNVTTPEAPEPPSVVLLPLENLSGEEDRYFVDGIAEDIITALSRFGSLLVIARDSSFHYRDRDMTVQQIGRELGARFIVRGSVRRAGPCIRLNVQLVDASTGKNLWAQRFDRELEDVFLVQDEVTATVVSTLAGRVEASRLAQARRVQPERLDAYDYVLRGKDHHHRYTEEDCGKAIEMFERAIERDPDYAIAHAWLACGLGQARAFRPDENEALITRAQEAAERARQLDENDAECYRVLAHVWLLRKDLARAQSHMERSLFLNPNDDRAVCAMGQILSFRGRHDEGAEWVSRAMRLNPYHPEFLWLHLGRALFHSGRHEEALSALSKVTRPRVSELVYRVAAGAGLGNSETSGEQVDALRRAQPEFNANLYVDKLPYEHEQDRNFLLDALRAAGF